MYLQMAHLLFLPVCLQQYIKTAVDVCDWDIYDCDYPYDIEVTEMFKCNPNDCPVNFKCCSHRCFRHNICQPYKEVTPEPRTITKTFVVKPGECDILLSCDIDLPSSFVKRFECLHDDDCPNHFKCCYIECYGISVCQPAKNEYIIDLTEAHTSSPFIHTHSTMSAIAQFSTSQKITTRADEEFDDNNNEDDENSGDYSTKMKTSSTVFSNQETIGTGTITTAINDDDDDDDGDDDTNSGNYLSKMESSSTVYSTQETRETGRTETKTTLTTIIDDDNHDRNSEDYSAEVKLSSTVSTVQETIFPITTPTNIDISSSQNFAKQVTESNLPTKTTTENDDDNNLTYSGDDEDDDSIESSSGKTLEDDIDLPISNLSIVTETQITTAVNVEKSTTLLTPTPSAQFTTQTTILANLTENINIAEAMSKTVSKSDIEEDLVFSGHGDDENDEGIDSSGENPLEGDTYLPTTNLKVMEPQVTTVISQTGELQTLTTVSLVDEPASLETILTSTLSTQTSKQITISGNFSENVKIAEDTTKIVLQNETEEDLVFSGDSDDEDGSFQNPNDKGSESVNRLYSSSSKLDMNITNEVTTQADDGHLYTIEKEETITERENLLANERDYRHDKSKTNEDLTTEVIIVQNEHEKKANNVKDENLGHEYNYGEKDKEGDGDGDGDDDIGYSDLLKEGNDDKRNTSDTSTASAVKERTSYEEGIIHVHEALNVPTKPSMRLDTEKNSNGISSTPDPPITTKHIYEEDNTTPLITSPDSNAIIPENATYSEYDDDDSQ